MQENKKGILPKFCVVIVPTHNHKFSDHIPVDGEGPSPPLGVEPKEGHRETPTGPSRVFRNPWIQPDSNLPKARLTICADGLGAVVFEKKLK